MKKKIELEERRLDWDMTQQLYGLQSTETEVERATIETMMRRRLLRNLQEQEAQIVSQVDNGAIHDDTPPKKRRLTLSSSLSMPSDDDEQHSSIGGKSISDIKTQPPECYNEDSEC